MTVFIPLEFKQKKLSKQGKIMNFSYCNTQVYSTIIITMNQRDSQFSFGGSGAFGTPSRQAYIKREDEKECFKAILEELRFLREEVKILHYQYNVLREEVKSLHLQYNVQYNELREEVKSLHFQYNIQYNVLRELREEHNFFRREVQEIKNELTTIKGRKRGLSLANNK